MEAADGVGVLERGIVVIHIGERTIPVDLARATVAGVKVRISWQIATCVTLHVDTVSVKGVTDKG